MSDKKELSDEEIEIRLLFIGFCGGFLAALTIVFLIFLTGGFHV